MRHKVKATRVGRLGFRAAGGLDLAPWHHGCALPSRKALHRWVRISYRGRAAVVQVLDVGPWNTADDGYVFGAARPQAESGRDTFGRRTNRAGIDLLDATWRYLGLQDNEEVEWEFVVPPGIGLRPDWPATLLPHLSPEGGGRRGDTAEGGPAGAPGQAEQT